MTQFRVGEQTPGMSIFDSNTIAWCDSKEQAWIFACAHAASRVTVSAGWQKFISSEREQRIILSRSRSANVYDNEYCTITVEEVYGV